MKGKIRIAIFAAIAIIILVSSISIVPAGHRGVVLQLGAVKDVVFDEGLNFKIPFIQRVVPMEVRVQKSESQQTAASKDMQNVSTTVAVNFNLEPTNVNGLYQDIGLDYKARIVDPAIGESVKAVTAMYTAEELISKRSEVSGKIKENLSDKLLKYDMLLKEINITEFNFSEGFNAAIESKQQAEQLALKAQRDLERIEIEAQQTIEQAKAEAESLRLKKQEVTPELVQLKELEVQEKALEVQEKAIKGWDGKLPSVTGGATPFFDISTFSNN